MTTKTHHFFMLFSSPWALVLSLEAFNLMMSLLIFFKYSNYMLLLTNLILIGLGFMFWCNSYSGEFNLEGKSSLNLEMGLKFGMVLFISSEVLFFFSFFWSYFDYFLNPTLEVGFSWPPVNVSMFDFSNVPLINTLILMSSGVTVTSSHYYLINNNLQMMMFWLWITVLLGVFFTYLQWLEYSNSFFSISDSSFGTSFFVLTGFHGAHVLLGSLFILSVLVRSSFLSSSAKSFLSFELASWYWHFVDVVWIFLFFFLYYLNY